MIPSTKELLTNHFNELIKSKQRERSKIGSKIISLDFEKGGLKEEQLKLDKEIRALEKWRDYKNEIN